ncbi:MAG: hypothetical protein IJ379_02095 [Lachnospiraceae bacterium]|nr:hypothetical protein [Lachnospiraceae bacterium]
MQCESCGGKLRKQGKNTYICSNCSSKYYSSMSFWKKLYIHLPVSRLVMFFAGVIMTVTLLGIIAYQVYTVRLVQDAGRFSQVFRDFLVQAYEKEVADISDEDLARLKYLQIKYEDGYVFEYSFQNPYEYAAGVEDVAYPKQHVVLDGKYREDSYIAKDIQYFSGLTKLVLYVETWLDYELAEDNVIRSITCQKGLSPNRNPQLFKQANPETLEEVKVYAPEEENLENIDFLQDIKGVKYLYLERVELEEVNVWQGFDKLEEVYLEYPVIEKTQALEIIEGILQCPNLKKLSIKGKAVWYLTDEEWQQLQEKYGDRVLMERL